MLDEANLRRKIGLSAQQESELQTISRKSQSLAQATFKTYEPNYPMKNLSPEEKKSKLAELEKQRADVRRKLERLGKDIIRQIEAVLTPAQQAEVTKITLQRASSNAILNADREWIKYLALSQEQQEKHVNLLGTVFLPSNVS
jgi:hypothetical protein